MRFEIAGLHTGPTDTDVARVSRHELIVRHGTAEDEAGAARLGLTAEQFQVLQASLAALNR
ncbi:hypothetical protein DEIGR_102569 [Deinococcus grandis]|uniref:Uncharacterized protein n=1 Tax=Deinococcus grandis TaxID=57498 RepID=A0A117DNZ2_9DEIO|nr:hypothetical protein [Deinococcus grandis]BBN93948.1 hypothetical protein DEGR_06810 [Deinococcus grandis]GAQ22542.1 hypothetical protein DEIGR_102569 [Deinococcus grandis]